MLKLFMGVKASLTLGREENPWVKGLVGLKIVVEEFYLMIRRFSFFHGVWTPLKPYASCFLGGISMCKKEKIL